MPEEINQDPLRMETNAKARFDALEAARAAEASLRTTRRDFEWKIGLAIWAAMGVAVSQLVGHPEVASIGSAKTTLFCVLVFACVLHSVFVWSIQKSNTRNMNRERLIQNEQAAMLGLPGLAEESDGRPTFHKFSIPLFQVGFTVCLASLAFGTVALSGSSKPQASPVYLLPSGTEAELKQAVSALSSRVAALERRPAPKTGLNLGTRTPAKPHVR